MEDTTRPGVNVAGLVGLILGIVGFVTCQCLCPVGMIVSFFGLKHPQKGLAWAGIIVGGATTLLMVVLIVMVLTGVAVSIPFLGTALEQAQVEITKTQLERVAAEVEAEEEAAGGFLHADSIREKAGTDSWGRVIQVESGEAGERRLVSLGPDGALGTEDDIVQRLPDR